MDNEEANGRHGLPLLRCLQTAIGWLTANLACEVFGRFYPERYVRVRYEDLIQAPRKTVKEIFGRVPLQSDADLEQAGSGDNRHQLYGNVMRFRPLLLSSLEEDVAWKREMPKSLHRITAITWPLAASYGYFTYRA
jgi:hypothetical protein